MRIKLLSLLWLCTMFAVAQTNTFEGNGEHFSYTSLSFLSIQNNSIDQVNNKPKDILVSQEISLEVFPNPANAILKFRSNIKISTLSLYNILGQKLKVYTMNKSSGAIHIKDLASGIYLVKFIASNNDMSVTKRILKN